VTARATGRAPAFAGRRARRAAGTSRRAPRGPFRSRIPVRFGDVDHARILYYPVFLHYFHVAFEEMWPARMGIRYVEVLDRKGLGFPTVHLDADFRRPVRYGDEVTVELVVERIGGRSVTLTFLARRASDRAVCAEARIVKACVRRLEFRAVSLPDWVRAGFETLRPRGVREAATTRRRRRD
jgi:YbgC/YbaW family acyl-CoA thioester hydrolase